MFRRLAFYELLLQEWQAIRWVCLELIPTWHWPAQTNAAPKTQDVASSSAPKTFKAPPVEAQPAKQLFPPLVLVPALPGSAPHRRTARPTSRIAAWTSFGGVKPFLLWLRTRLSNIGSTLKWAISALLAALLAGGAIAQVNYVIWQGHESTVLKQLELRLAQPVEDVNGNFLGVLPPPENTWKIGIEDVGTKIEVMPEECYLVLAAMEDGHAGEHWRHINGVDWPAVPRRFFAGKGASTLAMQLSSLAGGDKTTAPKVPVAALDYVLSTMDTVVSVVRARKTNISGSISRKSKEFAVARSLTEKLGGHRGVAQAYMSLAPFAIQNGEIKGLTNAAAAIFGTHVRDLSRAQCAVLMALPKRPLKLASDQIAVDWMAVQARATRGLRLAFKDADAAVAEVNAMPVPAIEPPASLAAMTRANVLPNLRAMRPELEQAIEVAVPQPSHPPKGTP